MDNACVFDTDVVSYLSKRDSRAGTYASLLNGAVPMISFMTVAELHRWTIERNWSPTRESHLCRYVERFAVVEVDRTLCRIWADVVVAARRQGRPIQVAAAWLAATALARDSPLLTHNGGDDAGVGRLALLSARAS